MCYKTHLRFNISLREIFSKSGSVRVVEKYDESGLMNILQEFGTVNMLTVKTCSETAFFTEWLTTSLTVCNFRNKVAMTIMSFFKMFKIWCWFPEMEHMTDLKLLVLKVTAFECWTENCHSPQQDTCHWLSMCSETPLRFNISLREGYSKSSSPEWWKNMMKLPSCRFYKTLGRFNMLTLKHCSETVFFRQWSN